MKQFILAFLIFLVWSFFGLWMYSSIKGSNSQGTVAIHNDPSLKENVENLEVKSDSVFIDSIQEIRTPNELDFKVGNFKAVTNDGDLIFSYEEGIAIQKNSSEIKVPSGSVDFKYKLNTYLVEHPDTELHILAYYDPDENVEAPNFGEQRGIAMMNLLSNIGILRERMVIKPTIKRMEFDSTDTYANGISFVFRPLDEERMKNPELYIPQSKSIYPIFAGNNIQPNQELKDLVEEIRTIFESDPSIKVEIIGHTDNIGSGQDNYALALKYARQVRWYLINKGGFDKNRIKALSKGESEPIADNKFRKGREKNRRIEVKYKTQ